MTKSTISTLKQGLPRSWVEWVHLAASLTSLGLIIALPLEVANELWEAIVVMWVCALLGGSLLLLYLQEVRYQRASRFAGASPSVREAFEKLRDASFTRLITPEATESAREDIKQAVTALATAFSVSAGATCRACVKQLRIPEGAQGINTRNVEVVDLCRSGNGAPTRKTRDFVSDNSDFEDLFKREHDVFFANDLRDLTRRGQYKNSHWSAETIANKEYTYLSTIVWPISKKLNDPSSAPKVGAISDVHDLLGFLCVDSLKTGVFDPETDVALGAAFASTLYAVLKTLAIGESSPLALPERSGSGHTQ